SLITLFVLYGISTRSGQTSVATMLLAGIAITALANAATGIFVFISTDQQLRDLTFWTLGSLGGATWDKVFVSSLFIAPAAFASLLIGRGLNGLLLGEAEAFHLGIDTQRLKRIIMVIVACAAGAAVAVAGIIGFVGIVVPHLLRLLIGADHRFLVPSSIMVGGTLLLLADMVARTIVTPAELPIGIVTALIGAPFFLWLLLKRRVALDV
ncbi:MAG: iron chelate uptake ABC transporter family permease subunit, partial [Pseudomonadota bacterium]